MSPKIYQSGLGALSKQSYNLNGLQSDMMMHLMKLIFAKSRS